MSDISTLRRRRGSIQGSITTLTKILDEWVANVETRNPDFLQASLETMQKTFLNFDNIQDKIEEIDETEVTRREPLIMSYNVAVGRARKYLREDGQTIPDNSGRSSVSSRQSPALAVKLPPITLPKFDGAVEEWNSFFDIFCSLIHDNEDLTAVRKLQYLRLSLTGKAASSIQSLETTDQNYEAALSILKKKFASTRRTLRRHMAILREYPCLQKDTPTALNSLVDIVYQHVRALETLGAPVDHWDIPLVDLILSKINATTAWHWELSLVDDNMPTYEHLLQFLEKRANCDSFATPKESQPSINSNPQRQDKPKNRRSGQAYGQPQVQTFTTKTSSSCPICSENHRIYQCDTFRKLSVENRERACVSASLCFNCLSRSHSCKDCKSTSTCHKCKKRHHTFLHKQSTATHTSPPADQSTSGTTQAEPPGQA